jgi:hypothetical protein
MALISIYQAFKLVGEVEDISRGSDESHSDN